LRSLCFLLAIIGVGAKAATRVISLPSGRLVAVVTPEPFIASGKCDLHFHGLRIASWDKTKRGTIDHFHFENLIPADTALIAPVASDGSYDLPKAYGTGFQATLKAVKSKTGIKCDRVTVSAHSAGGRVALALVLSSPKTFERLILLDATYSSNVAPFTAWLKSDSSRKLYSAARKNDGVYANASRINGATQNAVSSTQNHWDVVTVYLPRFLK